MVTSWIFNDQIPNVINVDLDYPSPALVPSVGVVTGTRFVNRVFLSERELDWIWRDIFPMSSAYDSAFYPVIY